MKRSRLVLLGLAVFVGTALFQAPVDRIYGWLAPLMAGSAVQFQGLSGTLSSGSASRIDLSGSPLIGNLSWELRALHLLMGRASYKLSGGSDGVIVDGTAFVVPSGTLTLSDFRLGAPLRTVGAAVGQAFVPAEGQVGLDIATLKLRDGWPVKADGLVTINGLAWKLGREPVPLGDYQAKIEDEVAGIKATLSTLRGALEVSGEARVGHDRSYELHLQMRPKPDASPLVGNLVRNLGQPDSQGWYHLRRSEKPPAEGVDPAAAIAPAQ
ncbi:MAG: type II secretion system protein N [Panacagrimonas sp.]